MRAKVFVDSSCSKVNNCNAYGMVVFIETGEIWYNSGNIPEEINHSDSYTAELYGLYSALYQTIKRFPVIDITMVCDSKFPMEKLEKHRTVAPDKGKKETERFRNRIVELFWFYANDYKVSFEWVESHQSPSKASIYGQINNFCDSLAKVHTKCSSLEAIDFSELGL